MKIHIAAITASLAMGWALAQPPDAAEFQRTSTTHRLAEFPKIHKDGRVWLQLKAPNAMKVQARGFGGKTFDMEKLADGVWNIVIPYPVPGVHYYQFIVDGLAVNDPGAEVFYSNGIKSAIETPNAAEDFYDLKDVPHGNVVQHMFYSKVSQSWRRMYIYLPAAYDANPRLRYPVLYLQHGAGEDEAEWTHAGRAQYILDNLIAAKKALPMIVVMNNGFVSRPGAATTQGAGASAMTGRTAAFEDMLLNEVIPDVDVNFRTIADGRHRALAGLSMGGMQTCSIFPRHLELFSYIGVFSGTSFGEEQMNVLLAQGAGLNKKVPVIFLTAGSREDGLIKRIQDTRARFDQAGIRTGYFVSQDTAHDFMTWRRSLHEFAPQLFVAGAAKK